VHAGLSRGLDAVILNPTGILGPYDYYPSYFGQAIISIIQGRLPALVQGGFDWVDVRDVVEAAIQAEQHAPSGASYLLSGHWHSVREVANLAAKMTGTRPPLLTVPIGLAYWAAPGMEWLARLQKTPPIYTRVALKALVSNRQISHSRATRELGYLPRPFRQTLADTLDWFVRNGYLKSSIQVSR
jgi:dihydroflavonol-4-reductase